MAEVLAGVAADAARVREADDLVDHPPLAAVQAELDRHRVRVAAGGGERVKLRDRPRARGEGERALRQDGDDREEREREQPGVRVEDGGERAERGHGDTGGQAVGEHARTLRTGWPIHSVA